MPSASVPAVAKLSPTLVTAADGSLAIAVDLAMLPHWHIYWSNPGDSGGATKLEAVCPPGWKVGAPRMPRPEVHGSSEDRAFGWEGEVRFLLPIVEHPEPMPATIAVSVKAEWMVCRESCLLGSATLTGSVSTAAVPNPPARAYPEPAHSTMRVRVEEGATHSTLVIEAPKSLVGEGALFVPDDSPGVRFVDGTGPFAATTNEASCVWELEFEIDPALVAGAQARVRGLVLAGAKINDRAFEISQLLRVPKVRDAGKAP
jgi:DsbC/DsbD-like thiol-disulfide interchange protein